MDFSWICFFFNIIFSRFEQNSVNRIANKENRKHLLPFIVFKRNDTFECVISMCVFLSFTHSFSPLHSYSLVWYFFRSLSLSHSVTRSFTAVDNEITHLDIVCINNTNRLAYNNISNATLKSRSNSSFNLCSVQQILFTRSLIIMFFCIQLSHNYCKIVPSALVIERHKQLLMNVAVQQQRQQQQ